MALDEFDFLEREIEYGKIINKIKDYLMREYGIVYEDAIDIAKILYHQYHLDMDKVMPEKIQKEIDDVVKRFIIRRNSIYKDGEERSPIQLQSSRRSPKIPTFVQVASFSLAAASVFFVYSHLTKPKPEEINVGYALNGLVDEKPNNGKDTTIVAQHMYRVGMDDNNYPVFAYDHHGIASDILKICRSNPELFDVTLNEIYKELNHNRLENMDEIFNILKIEMSKDESLVEIYERISDCDMFLDYIDVLGYIKTDEEYKAFEEYDNSKAHSKGIGTVFSNLSAEDQKVLEKLMKKYKNDERFKEFSIIIKNIIETKQQEYEVSSQKLGGL